MHDRSRPNTGILFTEPMERGYDRRMFPVRRVVTGLNAQGRSTIIKDEISQFHFAMPGIPDYGGTDIWRTDRTPADNMSQEEPCFLPLAISPQPDGSVFRIVQFPPDALYLDGFDRAAAFGAMADGHVATDTAEVHNPTMHQTHSVDYAVVLRGEVYLLLDDTEILLRAGDTLVQRGTLHGWSNRTDELCIVAFVLIDATPLPTR